MKKRLLPFVLAALAGPAFANRILWSSVDPLAIENDAMDGTSFTVADCDEVNGTKTINGQPINAASVDESDSSPEKYLSVWYDTGGDSWTQASGGTGVDQPVSFETASLGNNPTTAGSSMQLGSCNAGTETFTTLATAKKSDQNLQPHVADQRSLSQPALAGTARANDILWISVNPNAIVSDAGNESTVENYRSLENLAINAVRVCMSVADSETYLPVYWYDDAGGGWQQVSGDTGVDLPVSWQPMDAGNSASGSFQMQLGFYNTETDTFTTLATATETYASLQSNGHISETGSLSQPSQTPWSPSEFTAVPEPATGALALLGVAALLRSRRPRRVRARRPGAASARVSRTRPKTISQQPRETDKTAMKTKNGLLARCMLASSILLLSGSAFAGADDKVLVFSTPGVDRYADGAPVVDGECYALVWSPAGRAFSGFNADGTAVSAADRVVLAAPLAEDGRCPETLFQVPADMAAPLEGGTWAVCLVDTRRADGVPAGVANGLPRRVNRWCAVESGVKVSDGSGVKTASGRARAFAKGAPTGVRASTLSAVPESAATPVITDMAVINGFAVLAVADTVPYLTYTVESSEDLDGFGKDPYADRVDGDPDAEIVLTTDAPGDTRFFRINRAE